MSQTKAYKRGVAARKSVNDAVTNTGRGIARFAALFGDTTKGFVKSTKPAPRKRKPRAKK